jgi:hypothetical protein
MRPSGRDEEGQRHSRSASKSDRDRALLSAFLADASRRRELLRAVFGELDYEPEGHWVRLPRYPVPPGWSEAEGRDRIPDPPEVAVAPYAFCVLPSLALEGGCVPGNYSFPATTPWGSEWGRFSWSPLSWSPNAEVEKGDKHGPLRALLRRSPAGAGLMSASMRIKDAVLARLEEHLDVPEHAGFLLAEVRGGVFNLVELRLIDAGEYESHSSLHLTLQDEVRAQVIAWA